MNLRIFETTDDLMRATARTIVQRAAAVERPVIALSGGSTPMPMHRLLGQAPFRDELALKPVVWVVVDERYVPLDHPDSNAAMIEKTLFADGMSPGHRFLRFRTELGDPRRTAEDLEREWRSLEIERIDVVVLGVGTDGHTASLFPETPILDVEDRIAGEVFVPRLNAWRVTLTRPVIRNAGLRLVMVTGAAKRPIIEGVRDGVAYPITAATSGDIESWWFVDRDAAPTGTTSPR